VYIRQEVIPSSSTN